MKSRAQRYRYVRHVVSGTRPSPWSPLSLGTSLAAWYKADAGCYTDAACLFAAGSFQYLSKTSPTFAPTTKMTIRFWMKLTSSTSAQSVVSRWTGGQDQFLITVRAANVMDIYIAEALTSSSGNLLTTATTFADGVAYEIVIVYDGTLAEADRLKVYVDGVLDASVITGTIPASLTASTAPLWIGMAEFGQPVDGALARLGFSSNALAGAALTAAHTSTFWADMTAARQADWFSFYNLCEKDNTRVDSTGLNNLTPTNGPTVAAGPGEGLCVDNSPVKRWESSYGTRHLALATISQQPIYVLNRINGRPTVRVQAAGGAMVVAGADLSGLTGITLSALMRTPNASTDNGEVLAISVVDGAMIGRLNPPVSSGRRTTAWDAAGGNAANDTPFVGTARFNASGQRVRKDAGADGTSAQVVVLDGAIKYGYTSGGPAFEAAELVVVSTDLSDAVTAQLVSYLMTRGGI